MRFCWAQYTLWAVILVLGVLSMLAGCGAKGDLFLPPEVVERIKQEKQQAQLALAEEQRRRDHVLAALDAAYAAVDTPPPGSTERREALSMLLARLEAAYVAPPAPPQETAKGTPAESATVPQSDVSAEAAPSETEAKAALPAEQEAPTAATATEPPVRETVLEALRTILEQERDRLLRLYEELTVQGAGLPAPDNRVAGAAEATTAATGSAPPLAEGSAATTPAESAPADIARKRRVVDDLLELIDAQ